MAEIQVNSDVVMPRELIVPTVSGSAAVQPSLSGALFISGSNLVYAVGSAKYVITATST